MAKDEVPRLAQQRARRMLRDLQEGAFVVLAFPDDKPENVRVYASGLDPDKMRKIESFIQAVIDE